MAIICGVIAHAVCLLGINIDIDCAGVEMSGLWTQSGSVVGVVRICRKLVLQQVVVGQILEKSPHVVVVCTWWITILGIKGPQESNNIIGESITVKIFA